MNYFTYYQFDRGAKYREQKLSIVNSYNLANNTGYVFISEFIHCLYAEGVKASKIAEILSVTTGAIFKALCRMDVPREQGVANNICKLSATQIREIRASNASPLVIRERYGISTPTVLKIRRREGRWAKI